MTLDSACIVLIEGVNVVSCVLRAVTRRRFFPRYVHHYTDLELIICSTSSNTSGFFFKTISSKRILLVTDGQALENK